MNAHDDMKIRGSASGGLHASSMGETYPWTAQPRVRWISAEPTLGAQPQLVTVWVAFNALTGEEKGAYLNAEVAVTNCRTNRAQMDAYDEVA